MTEETLNAAIAMAQEIDKLHLDHRAYNCLVRYGIKFIYEVCAMTEEDLLKIRSLGVSTANHIKHQLEKQGLRLREQNGR